MISFTLWIGAILFFLFVFAPAVRSLPPRTGIDLLNRGRHSFQTLSWIVIALLLITGIVDFLSGGRATVFTLGSTYSLVLATKLLLFLAMVLHHCIQAFKYAPRIDSITAQTSPETSNWPKTLLAHWQRWFLLLKINGTIGPLVLLLALGLRGI